MLVSSPALNFGYGVASYLDQDQQVEYIMGMYRNLFASTIQEGRNYIAMPAAGLGEFKGKPDVYFNTLMLVASEFPTLNIIYNPAKYVTAFEKSLLKAKPINVVRATKDVVFVANELCKAGYPCAFHNPSDSDVVYGVYDIGEYWKTGQGIGYVGEEHIGSLTTAPLNSRGLNPDVYSHAIERSCSAPILAPELIPIDHVSRFIRKFDSLLKTFDITLSSLREKAKHNKKYKKVGESATQLYASLHSEFETFSHAALTLASKDLFFINCVAAFTLAEPEFSKHRGLWAQINPVLKAILGVLAALTVIPALIVAATTKSGYSQTFFAEPPTASHVKLREIAAKIYALDVVTNFKYIHKLASNANDNDVKVQGANYMTFEHSFLAENKIKTAERLEREGKNPKLASACEVLHLPSMK